MMIKTKGEDRGEGKEPVIPRLAPQPSWCRGVEEPVLCLDGEWEVEDNRNHSMQRVKVPYDMGILHRKGLSGLYTYHRRVKLPEIPAGYRTVLKFEGVNGFATVYVEGEEVAFHQNGFLTWNVEITEQIRGKKEIDLRIAMDEEADQVSSFSHGGILRSVYLYILPEAYMNGVYLSPLFDEDMDSCTLRVDLDVSWPADWDGITPWEMEFRLTKPGGDLCLERRVRLDNREDGYYSYSLPVGKPILWDAEHPALYSLEMKLIQNGTLMETVRKKTGLRRLERKGNRLFVNQQEVKLRGVCRHEISPRSGRALTRELIEQDVALFKEANCNYIRTSHYPPSEYFLELCDEYGIYVEDELALAFIARTLPYTQRDPEQTDRYLSHFTECLARDYNHPSVIIWSLCNESFGGYNFDLLNRYVHKKDPTRMTKFSYPMTIREEHEMPDIWSIHYSEYNADLSQKRDNLSVGHAPGRDMPVLHDEYVHVSCYNREEMRRDPAIHAFWGQSIRIFWDNIWNTEGALGGAIWAGIDETDIYDGGNTRLEWGIIDVWRRKKPEFYMTRKAYSPIRVIHSQLLLQERKALLVLENRFCHTSLSEVCVQWEYGTQQGCMYLPEAEPGMTAKVFIALPEVEPGEEIKLLFLDAGRSCVDEIVVKERGRVIPSLWEDMGCTAEKREPDKLAVQETETETVVQGSGFKAAFSRSTGLLTGLWAVSTRDKGGMESRLLTGGPYLNAPYLKLGDWYLTAFSVRELFDRVQVQIKGGYEKTLSMTWEITIDQDGTLTTSYYIEHLEKCLPRQLKLRVGVDCGGLDELGVAYLAAPFMDSFTWRRAVDPDALEVYSWYPKNHISRITGTAKRYAADNVWGEQPQVSWEQDVKNDMLCGYYDVDYKGTNDFRATKENVAEGYLYGGKEQGVLAVLGDGDNHVHVRLEVLDPEEWKIKENDPRVRYTGTWYCVEDRKESDHGTERWSHEKGAAAECTFTGTGIVWYGPQDTTYGKANVYIDGRLVAKGLSQRVAGADFSCSSVGYDKKYHLPIFSVTGLTFGEHEIRVEVCGEKEEDASDTYIVLDYFRVLNGEQTEPVKLMLNQEFSFPHLSWGNYRKPPILLEEGTRGRVRMKPVPPGTGIAEEVSNKFA